MNARRAGMALPAALAAMLVLAALAALANISATNAIREARAMADAARTYAQTEALYARAHYQLRTRTRAQLIASSVTIGNADTAMTTTALTWPWHRVSFRTGGTIVAAEFARARIPANPWCNAAVFSSYVRIAAGTVSMPSSSSCPDTIRAGVALVAAFDSALVADLIDIGNSDTLAISGTFAGVGRARSRIEIAAGAEASGIFIAPVVRVAGGATVRGIVIARDSLITTPGASVTADYTAIFAAVSERARLETLGRRGIILLP